MKQEVAETLALQALGWLTQNDELLSVFMGSTGASAEDLRTRARDPEFLGAVLDFILMDDAWIGRFCDAQGYDYTAPIQARAALTGGEQTHWT